MRSIIHILQFMKLNCRVMYPVHPHNNETRISCCIWEIFIKVSEMLTSRFQNHSQNYTYFLSDHYLRFSSKNIVLIIFSFRPHISFCLYSWTFTSEFHFIWKHLIFTCFPWNLFKRHCAAPTFEITRFLR